MSKIKGILFIDAATGSGEGQRNLAAIIAHLDDSKYRSYVLSADDSESGLVARFKGNKDVPAEFVEISGWNRQDMAAFGWMPDLLKIRPVIRKWLNEYDVDIVYANGFYSGVLCSLTVPQRFPVLFHARDYHCSGPAMEYIIKRAAGTLFVSNFVQKHWLKKVGDAYADTVTTVFNGFDWDAENQVTDGFSFRENYVWPAETIFVTAVADMCPTSNFELFLRAFETAYSRNPNLFALIIGRPDGSIGHKYLEDLEIIARDSRLLGAVSFMEFVNNIGPLVEASNVIVSITDNEPFGESIVYAIKAGKPIVLTAGAGPQEISRDYKGARVVRPDAESIAKGILDAVDKDNCQQVDRNEISAITERFTIKRQIEAIDRFIAERLHC